MFYQLCKEQNACKGTMEIMAQNNLNLPKIIKEDGCYQPGFQKASRIPIYTGKVYAFCNVFLRASLKYFKQLSHPATSRITGT